jgi:hypothetical protein
MDKWEKSLEIFVYSLPCRICQSATTYIILKECVISFFIFNVRLRYWYYSTYDCLYFFYPLSVSNLIMRLLARQVRPTRISPMFYLQCDWLI